MGSHDFAGSHHRDGQPCSSAKARKAAQATQPFGERARSGRGTRGRRPDTRRRRSASRRGRRSACRLGGRSTTACRRRTADEAPGLLDRLRRAGGQPARHDGRNSSQPAARARPIDVASRVGCRKRSTFERQRHGVDADQALGHRSDRRMQRRPRSAPDEPATSTEARPPATTAVRAPTAASAVRAARTDRRPEPGSASVGQQEDHGGQRHERLADVEALGQVEQRGVEQHHSATPRHGADHAARRVQGTAAPPPTWRPTPPPPGERPAGRPAGCR